jgi:3-oxoacyl-[acyl-carrier-protein] synthase III
MTRQEAVGRWEAASVPPLPETIETTVEQLSAHSVLKLETVEKGELGIGGTTAHWGQRYTSEEIDEIVRKVFGDVDELKGNTGFEEIYRVPESYSYEDAIEEEMGVIKRLVEKTLELNNWERGQVEALYFAGSPVKLPNFGLDYGAAIAKETGLTHLTPEMDIHNYFLACNAAGRALKDILIREEKKVLLLAGEGLTKQAGGLMEKKTDVLSARIFSDAAAAIGVEPNKTLTYLLGEHMEIEDKRGALAATPAWQELVDPGGDLIQKRGNISLIRLPQPPKNKILEMRGKETTKIFLKIACDLAEKVYQLFEDEYPGEEIKMIIAHHPSRGVNLLVERRLERMNIKIPMPWVVNDGNSSGATSLVAFVRLLNQFSPGDRFLFASFGAGASADFWVGEFSKA